MALRFAAVIWAFVHGYHKGDRHIPATTATRLIDLLETLYLVPRAPGWATNLSKRVVRTRKAMLLDTGSGARLVNATTASLGPGTGGDTSTATMP